MHFYLMKSIIWKITFLVEWPYGPTSSPSRYKPFQWIYGERDIPIFLGFDNYYVLLRLHSHPPWKCRYCLCSRPHSRWQRRSAGAIRRARIGASGPLPLQTLAISFQHSMAGTGSRARHPTVDAASEPPALLPCKRAAVFRARSSCVARTHPPPALTGACTPFVTYCSFSVEPVTKTTRPQAYAPFLSKRPRGRPPICREIIKIWQTKWFQNK